MKFLYLLLACLSSSDCLILTSSVERGEAVCPGEEITLTCTVIEGVSLGWISEPYIPWLNAVTFTSTEWLRVGVPVHHDPFQIVLRNITSNSSQANLTSILSFIATSTLNGTVVECDSDSMTARITLHIAAPPPPPHNPTYIIKQRRGGQNATISVQWEYPHWMEADVFTVTVPGLMPSIFVPGGNRSATLTLNYNETYTIEITATKCGNHSDPALLTVAEVQVDCGPPSLLHNGTVIYQNTTVGSEAHYHCSEGFTLEGQRTTVCGAGGNWSPSPVCETLHAGDDAVAWKVLVMVVSITLTAACATFLITIFTLMCWRKRMTTSSMKKNCSNPRHMESQPDADNGTKDVPCYDSAKTHPDLIYSELNTQPQTKSLIPPPEQPTDVQYSTLVYDVEKRSTDDIHPVDKTSVRRGFLHITVTQSAATDLGELDEPPPILPKHFSFDEEPPPALPPQTLVVLESANDNPQKICKDLETGCGTQRHVTKLSERSAQIPPDTQFKVLPPSQIQQQNVAPVRPESKNKMPLNPPKMTIE